MSPKISKRLLRIIATAVIVVIIAITMAHLIAVSKRLLSSFPLIGWIEIVAEVSVAIGCLGELVMLFLREPEEDDVAGKRIHRAWERIWMALVFVGVGVSVPCLIISLRDSAALNQEAAELRQENNEFAAAYDPRRLDPYALLQALQKTHGLNFVVVNIPDWEAGKLATGMERSFDFERRVYGAYRQWKYSRMVSPFDIPDGVHIGLVTPPNPFDRLPAFITREDRMKLNEDEVKAFMNFEPSKESLDAAKMLKNVFESTGIVADNLGKALAEEYNVMSRLGISSPTFPTNTVVILIGHKPDPRIVSLSSVRAKAWNVQMGKSSAGDISNAWYAVFVAEEEYRNRQIALGLWPTNAPHPVFNAKGWYGDGAPIK